MMLRPRAAAFGSWLAALVIAGILIALAAPPARAHAGGADATNYRSEITSAPASEGISWRVLGGDSYLEVTNLTGAELTVLGYDGEPYLRVGPQGVWENRNSPAPYQNADRYMRTAPPAGVSADLEPDWVKRSDAPRAAWHDHRIHWMSPDLPPIVAENPGRETVVNREWQVPYLHGGQELVVRGQLRWVPGPSPWPWVLAGLALTAPALTGLRRHPACDGRWVGLVRPAAAVLAAAAALNLVHVAHALLEAPLPLASRLLGVGQTGVFVGIAAFGALRGSQAREGGFAALGIGSAALLFGAGLLNLSLLGASQISGVLPDPATRMIVGLSIAQALPVGAVAAIGSRRSARLPRPSFTARETL